MRLRAKPFTEVSYLLWRSCLGEVSSVKKYVAVWKLAMTALGLEHLQLGLVFG